MLLLEGLVKPRRTGGACEASTKAVPTAEVEAPPATRYALFVRCSMGRVGEMCEYQERSTIDAEGPDPREQLCGPLVTSPGFD